MYKATTITVTSKTVPVLLFSVTGTANAPTPVDVYNAGQHTILVGSSTEAHCLRPIPKGTSMQFGVIGSSSLYAKLTGTTSVPVVVLIGP